MLAGRAGERAALRSKAGIDHHHAGLIRKRVLVYQLLRERTARNGLEKIGRLAGIDPQTIAPGYRPVRLRIVVAPEDIVALFDFYLRKNAARTNGNLL